MKLSEGLKTTQRLYIETAPLIYYVETNPAYIARMDAIIAAVENGAFLAFSSVLVHNQDLRLLSITTRIAETAADLRARYNLRTPDALHVAAALDSGCDAFLTNDIGIRRVTEIAVWVLDELELDLPKL
ncbi:MAG: PIN domain-containing protein [Anaerolineae bacterium]|nr:PIN domain-containing protein [Anaerolineae bacterium]